ncbi:MAG TPA: TolC family protein [Steroidobacteraceae bacterium]|nr:TolC family protein [Steroidobacteraceae bacterium]
MRSPRVPFSSLAIAALLAAPVVGSAEPTLITAWQGVRAHSAEYAAAVARRDAGAAARETARALWLPTLAAQGALAHRSYESDTTGAQFSAPGFGTSTGVDFRTSVNGGNARQWAFIAQQPLFDAARVADSQAASARSRLAEAQFQQIEQALMVRTAETLAAVVESGARWRAVQRQRDAAMRARDLAHERYEAGDLPVTEWREAQAQADQLAVLELDAQQAFAVANEAFANLTGLAPPIAPTEGGASQRPVTTGASELRGSLAPVANWLQRARDQSPLLAIHSERQALAEAELRRWSRIDGFQLSLVGQYGRETLTGTGDYGDAGATQRLATIGLQFTVPLFTGGLRSAQRHAAESSLRAARADLEGAQQDVELQVRSAWLAASNARARLQATVRAQESADSRLDATRIGHEAGDRTLLDLLAAEGAALNAEAGAAAARCEGLLATLRLAAATGSLDEAALKEAANGEFSCGYGPGNE